MFVEIGCFVAGFWLKPAVQWVESKFDPEVGAIRAECRAQELHRVAALKKERQVAKEEKKIEVAAKAVEAKPKTKLRPAPEPTSA